MPMAAPMPSRRHLLGTTDAIPCPENAAVGVSTAACQAPTSLHMVGVRVDSGVCSCQCEPLHSPPLHTSQGPRTQVMGSPPTMPHCWLEVDT